MGVKIADRAYFEEMPEVKRSRPGEIELQTEHQTFVAGTLGVPRIVVQEGRAIKVTRPPSPGKRSVPKAKPSPSRGKGRAD